MSVSKLNDIKVSGLEFGPAINSSQILKYDLTLFFEIEFIFLRVGFMEIYPRLQKIGCFKSWSTLSGRV